MIRVTLAVSYPCSIRLKHWFSLLIWMVMWRIEHLVNNILLLVSNTQLSGLKITSTFLLFLTLASPHITRAVLFNTTAFRDNLILLAASVRVANNLRKHDKSNYRFRILFNWIGFYTGKYCVDSSAFSIVEEMRSQFPKLETNRIANQAFRITRRNYRTHFLWIELICDYDGSHPNVCCMVTISRESQTVSIRVITKSNIRIG